RAGRVGYGWQFPCFSGWQVFFGCRQLALSYQWSLLARHVPFGRHLFHQSPSARVRAAPASLIVIIYSTRRFGFLTCSGTFLTAPRRAGSETLRLWLHTRLRLALTSATFFKLRRSGSTP